GLAQELAVESRMLLEQWVESLVAIAQQAIAQRLDTVEMLAKQLVLLLEPGEGRGDAVDVLAPHLFTDELQLAAPRFALFAATVGIDGFDYFLAQGQLSEAAGRHCGQLFAKLLQGGHLAFERRLAWRFVVAGCVVEFVIMHRIMWPGQGKRKNPSRR